MNVWSYFAHGIPRGGAPWCSGSLVWAALYGVTQFTNWDLKVFLASDRSRLTPRARRSDWSTEHNDLRLPVTSSLKSNPLDLLARFLVLKHLVFLANVCHT